MANIPSDDRLSAALTSAAADTQVTRRDFLGFLVCGGCALVGASLFAGCSSNLPRYRGALANGRIAIDLAEYERLAGDVGGIRIDVEEMPEPIALVRREGVFHAVSAKCTHKGCTISAKEDVLRCPCHGSMFDFDGRLLGGPAKEPLTKYDVRVAQGVVEISVPW